MAEELLKVLLVDDEDLIRDLLKECIPWNDLGMEIAGEAASAREALELVERLVPDIIFTDICMPFIDGIEFSKKVLAKYPQIKIIIITGYDDFEYARRSIKAGVLDFILKPINDEEITRVALRMKAKIVAEKTRWAEYERIKAELVENLPYLKERFLNTLITGYMAPEEIAAKRAYYQISLAGKLVQAAVLELIDPPTNQGEEDELILRLRCLELVKKTQWTEDFEAFFDNRQRIVILKNYDPMDPDACFERLKVNLLRQIRRPICIGVGNPRPGLEYLRASYREACHGLKYRIVAGRNKVIHYREIDLPAMKEESIQDEQLELFAFYLKVGVKDQAEELLTVIIDHSLADHDLSIEPIRVVASNIIAMICSAIQQFGIELADVFGKGRQPYERIFKIDNLPELRQYLHAITGSVITLIGHAHHRKVRKVIQEIQEFLAKNYRNPDLSLTTVAKTFYLNPSYISRIFKQETGRTFIEYLTQIRMEKAIQLLNEPNLRAYQIAERVGIADPHYFGVCFKKYTGMPVNDYKKSKGRFYT